MNLSRSDFQKGIVPFAFDRINRHYSENLNQFPPVSLELQLTARCNYKCNYCAYKNRNRENGELSKGVIAELLNSISELGISYILLSGGGEPTLHPYIRNIIEFLSNLDCKIGLITNGSNMEIIEGLEDRLEYIQVSIPDTDSAGFESIAGISSKVLNKVLAYPPKVKGKTKVGAKVIITDDNCLHIADIIDRIRSAGFDNCYLKIVGDYENTGLALSRDNLKITKEIVAGLQRDSFSNAGDLFIHEAVPPTAEKCWSLFYKVLAIVDPKANVYSCIPYVQNKDYSIGNLNDNPFEEIWGSDQHKDVVEKLNTLYKNGKCSNCRCLGYNGIFEQLESMYPKTEIILI